MSEEAAALDLNLQEFIGMLQLSQKLDSIGLPEACGFLNRAALIAEVTK